MTQTLDHYFSLHRRYHRSINLERDFDKPDAVEGYILTARSGEALQRIITAIANPRAHHAWTITGAYGTGKSAFALFLAALCAPVSSEIAQSARSIAQHTLPTDSPILKSLSTHVPDAGLLRAVVAGQREPLRWTIIRAITAAIHQNWTGKRKPEYVRTWLDWDSEVAAGRCDATNQQVLDELQQLIQLSKMDVLLVIDELGKNLEYAAQHRGTEDLYLLQQIAELRKGKQRVYLLGLLHQSFAGYSEQLTTIEQNEWTKIQGRFENLQLMDAPSQTTRLIGLAIAQADTIAHICHQHAQDWHRALQAIVQEQELPAPVLASIAPLHPLTALVLPLLCTRYAQNDRSLFTFLTSDEPFGLTQFLQTHALAGDIIPTLKLHQLYDYFVESAAGLANQTNLQRWVEIQRLIQESQTRDEAVLQVLKTIGILNLVASTGSFKASPELVALALCDRPNDKAALKQWRKQIERLKQQGTITHRVLADELRIWEGSDFDVEAAILHHIESQQRSSLSALLTQTHPLKPVVAQRHYTTTGNLRYFEQRYLDTMTNLAEVACQLPGADGLIGYWLESDAPSEVPAYTADGKPFVLITTPHLEQLRLRAQHLQALQTIQAAPELDKDVVARKEVNHRLSEADRLLNDTMQQAFRWADEQNLCWIAGQLQPIHSPREFQAALSDLCDRTYAQGLVLDNELINRRELTSQGAKARRELIEAMLERGSQARLGFEGYGPEVAMYGSVLEATQIHRQENGVWGFCPPSADAGVATVWDAIAQFCLDATEQPRSLDQLYHQLASPPYGVKPGVVPVLLAAVLLHLIDEISVYKDGTFIPVLGAEHFELLVKDPARFAVKHIAVVGLRSQVFRELEAILRSSPAKGQPGTRNRTILSVVKPLVQFVRKLPTYTVKSKRISAPAQAVIQTLLQTQEPDDLLFSALPQACGLEPIRVASKDETATDSATARRFREQLVQILREIHTAYEALLNECEVLLYNAFGLRSDLDQLRLDLQFRAQYLLGNCAERTLDRFVRAAVDETKDKQAWLESLLMIVADKPAEAWSDADFITFEHNLGDLARRFKNWEALQKDVAARNQGGFEACRLTVTSQDGSEVHGLVCIDEDQKAQLESDIAEILAKYPSPQMQQALLALYATRVMGDQTTSTQKRDRRSAAS
ncbi:MAG: hypothetical protein NW220_08660 [Leptolyngbyaceae cyanobacterium bins.349]|nr:hypothetical protein [Leptolyngbyaceae cyanobacterium bins.349]